jgi:orotate phosphoribosyltransferase
MTRISPESPDIEKAICDAVAASHGHFVYESGHHGDLWLDLDALFVDARRVRRWAVALGDQATACQPDLVCGPLTGGAFIAQLLAAKLGAGFVFAERLVSEGGAVQYRIPESLRKVVHGKRVLLVDDVINAGSAVLATLRDLLDCGAELAGIAALLTLGRAAAQIAEKHSVPLFALAPLEREMWTAEECPLCRSGVPLGRDRHNGRWEGSGR